MVTQVNGSTKAGLWFSADVRFATVTVAGGTPDFIDDEAGTNGVNTELDSVIEALETRGTVIGLTVTAAGVLDVIVDYAQAYDDAAVITELEVLINAVGDFASTAITPVGVAFAAA